MVKYCFNVPVDHVVPTPYPFTFVYWHVGSAGDHEYQLIAEVDDEAQIREHWPHARTIEPVLSIFPADSLVSKRSPTGRERSNVRLRFNYPEDALIPEPDFPDIPSWRQKGGDGFLTWVTVSESFAKFQAKWPKAWNVSIIADGMVC